MNKAELKRQYKKIVEINNTVAAVNADEAVKVISKFQGNFKEYCRKNNISKGDREEILEVIQQAWYGINNMEEAQQAWSELCTQIEETFFDKKNARSANKAR